MRGTDARSGELFFYADLEHRVPAKHPLRLVRTVVNDVLAALDGHFVWTKFLHRLARERRLQASSIR